jgi:hypothetical protein
LRKEHPDWGVRRIGDELGVSKDKVHRILKRIEKGDIEVTEDGKDIPIYNVVPIFWVEDAFVCMFNVFFIDNILPITFLMLKPKVIIVSLPNGGLL